MFQIPFRCNVQERGFTLITGYELREGRVFALDRSTSSETNFSIYDGIEEASFLNKLKLVSASDK